MLRSAEALREMRALHLGLGGGWVLWSGLAKGDATQIHIRGLIQGHNHGVLAVLLLGASTQLELEVSFWRSWEFNV